MIRVYLSYVDVRGVRHSVLHRSTSNWEKVFALLPSLGAVCINSNGVSTEVTFDFTPLS